MDWLWIALRLFGLSDWVQDLIDRWQARQQGREDQVNADLKASNETLRHQNQAQADAPTTRAELEQLLEEGKL